MHAAIISSLDKIYFRTNKSAQGEDFQLCENPSSSLWPGYHAMQELSC